MLTKTVASQVEFGGIEDAASLSHAAKIRIITPTAPSPMIPSPTEDPDNPIPPPAPRVARLLGGDDAVLAELFAEFRPRLWRLVHFRLDRRLQGRIDADDVLQDAYLSAVQRLPHFRRSQPLDLFLWLRLIVVQTLVDLHRQHLGAQKRDAHREQTLPSPLSDSTSHSLSYHLLAHLTTPSQAALRAELTQMLHQALEQMPTLDREILALRHFEELSNVEVGQLLGIETACVG